MSEDSREKEKAMPLEGMTIVIDQAGTRLLCMFCETVLLCIPVGSSVFKHILADVQRVPHECVTIREWDHTG